jgi:DNA-binding transcriptional LysR family regulator
MQIKNWNDLRYILAIQRGLTIAAAARALGVDQTTVSRRLAALQEALGRVLVVRQADGTLHLTPDGLAIADRAQAMERQIDLAADGFGDTSCIGTVRLTAVPILANRLLVPAMAGLFAAYPGLLIELIPEGRDLSLLRREADLAIRLARPEAGGAQVIARRIGYLDYAVYAGQADAADLPWIIYDEALAHLPQARWLAKAARGRAFGLRVHDAETALEAVLAGHGKTLLPRIVADGDPRLHRQDSGGYDDLPRRDIWILSHKDRADLARIIAVTDWLRRVLVTA